MVCSPPEEITALQKYNMALLKEHDIDFRIILENNGLRGAAFNTRTNALMEKLAQNTQSEQGRMILLYVDSSFGILQISRNISKAA